MKIAIGSKVTVKSTHREDLDGNPATGTVLSTNGRKVTIIWDNEAITSHQLNSPYMWRFNISA
jgi:hypothetical protein